MVLSSSVRIASAGDVAHVARVLTEAFRQYRPLYTAEAFAATTLGTDIIRARLDEGPTWIADLEGSVAGTISAVARGDGVYIRSMAVLPSARGLGVGRALLAVVEAFARGVDARRLYLSTTPFLDAAIRLYEAAGFERTDQPPFELHGTPLFTMQKRLSAVGPPTPPRAPP